MKKYILPEGFEEREKYVKPSIERRMILVFPNGHYDSTRKTSNAVLPSVVWDGTPWVGFKFMEPLKVVERYEVFWCAVRKCWVIRYNPSQVYLACVLRALNKNTPEHESAATQIKNIYEENTV